MELLASGNLVAPPSLSINQSAGNFVLSWPNTNAEGFNLYVTTNVAAGIWTASPTVPQTNGAQMVVTQAFDLRAKFFRLQGP